ncbi:Rab-like protein 6 [Sparganum proliferum]
MSTLWKFFARDSRHTDGPKCNGNFHPLRPELQRRFANGVKYNMKLVIRGDRRTGKTALFTRLKGEPFSPDYTATDEIQVACILWGYKETDEVVKVEVWDVVDKGKPRNLTQGSRLPRYARKLMKEAQPPPSACLDSTFIDVYKGASGVLLIFDMTKRSSFEYVRRELPRVPSTLPVLVLANCRDLAAERTVSDAEARALVSETADLRKLSATPSILEEERFAPIRYCEASMRNGFGLLYVHRFINIPFLALQRLCLLRLLAENSKAFSGVQQELDRALANQDVICSYEKFTQWLDIAKSSQPKTLSSAPMAQDHSRSPNHTGNNVSFAGAQIISDREQVRNGNLAKPESRNTSQPCNKPFSDNCPNDESPKVSTPTVSNDRPLVAAFQEDIDPADANFSRTGAKGGRNLSGRRGPLNGVTVAATANTCSSDREFDAMATEEDEDEDDDDDDDGLNEDDDDDEEHLGPALGLRFDPKVPPVTETPSLATFESSTRAVAHRDTAAASRSCSPSSSSSPSAHSTSPATMNRDCKPVAPEALNPGFLIEVGAEDQNAFERFLDDV